MDADRASSTADRHSHYADDDAVGFGIEAKAISPRFAQAMVRSQRSRAANYAGGAEPRTLLSHVQMVVATANKGFMDYS